MRCLRGAVSEYGLSTLRSRTVLKYRVLRSRAYHREVRRALETRFGDRSFAFTLQTQSLFNAKLPMCPHYVYTDHVARARYVVGQDDVGPPSDAWLALEQELYDSAVHIFTFGPTIRRFLIDSYGTPRARVSAIGAGASVVPKRPVDTTLGRYSKRNILFVGVEWERKGGPELIAAFAALRKHLPDTTLTVIGCTPNVAIEGCRVLGRLPPEDVERHFQDASCFCMPSRLEPFGIVFTEAMQFGLPIVATSVGDIGAIVREGDTGLLVPAENSTALALALRQVLESAERCREFGLRSLARAESFTWTAVVRRLTAHLQGARAGAAGNGAIW
jgi:glycosyltransferase involved in cell wall biosynthesis